ncbi:DUF3761 domain-containing protein [Stenotrophomonas maltophilia]|uniref:DUF3761 domain-containing protein n=1 Tax=Stenotrophomonas maltophilia TaxID=40324 RepID=UPI00209AA7F4|nr:DUF3761 domain-containing protein [Stenotrophomonas maltophilia]MCO7473028.1 DUF3761 domain-containing protein [Stenotrophomonas maltophilia]
MEIQQGDESAESDKLAFYAEGGAPGALRYSLGGVRRALNAYQLHLDQWMAVEQLPGMKISVRALMDTDRAQRGDEWIRARCVPMSPKTPPMAPRKEISSPTDGPPFPSRVAREKKRRMQWGELVFWGWLAYVSLGLFFVLFVNRDPELTVFGIAKAAFVSILIFVLIVCWLATMLSKLSDLDYTELLGKTVLAVVLVVGGWFGTIFYKTGYEHLTANQLAPLSSLFQQCLEDGIEYGARKGAICMDGRRSGATGSGACSHHGGVAYWRHNEKQTRSDAQCRAEASKISWRWRYKE